MRKLVKSIAAVLSTLSALLLFAVAGGASVKGW
jgi:hypothetical protein